MRTVRLVIASIAALTFTASAVPAAAATDATRDGLVRRYAQRQAVGGVYVRATDVCADAGGSVGDVRRADLAFDVELDGLLFAVDLCHPVRAAEWAGRQVAWLLTGSLWDYEVWVYRNGGNWITQVERGLPGRNPDTIIYTGIAAAPEGDRFILGFAPSHVVPDDELLYRVAVRDSFRVIDRAPEDGEPPAAFPIDCTTAFYRHTTIGAEPGMLDAVAAAVAPFGNVVRRLPELDALEVIADPAVAGPLARLPGVRYVEPVSLFTRTAVTPNDPEAARQWALTAVAAHDAWDVTTGSNDVVVAVLDDGVDGSLPDLARRVVGGWDTSLPELRPLRAGANSDRGGHGTMVAGVLAATGDNGHGIAGVDWRAKIMPMRVFTATDCSSDQAVAAAFVAAAEEGVDVINVSLGAERDTTLLRDAVAYATNRDVVVVAAVGNSGEEENKPGFPAAYPDVIGVGATTRDGAAASYSVTSRVVDVAAPGGNGSGTVEGDVLTYGEFGALTAVAGTSFAAPMVAGAAALYLAVHPGARREDVERALFESAVDVAPAGRDSATGYGLLNLPAMLDIEPQSVIIEADIDVSSPTAAAIDISRLTHTSGKGGTVLLSSAQSFADALAGAVPQAVLNAPLLLTDPDRLSEGVHDEMDRLGAQRVVILGGTAAVSEAVADRLRALGFEVERVAAADRVATSVAVAERFASTSKTAILVRAFGGDTADPARGFVDALGTGALAAVWQWPILLTETGRLSPAVRDYLYRSDIEEVLLVGGTSAVSAAVEQETQALGILAWRLSGIGRAETAVAVAGYLAPAEHARSAVVIDGSRADAWAFGLGLAGYAADRGAPVLLASGTDLPDATAAYLRPEQSRAIEVLAAGLHADAVDTIRDLLR